MSKDYKLLKYVEDQDIYLVKKSVELYPRSIKYAKVLDQEICGTAVLKDCKTIFYIPLEYLDDNTIVNTLCKVLEVYGEYQDKFLMKISNKFEQKYIRDASDICGCFLSILEDIDYDLVYKLVEKNGKNISYVPNEYLYYDLCKLAIDTYPRAIFDKNISKFVDDKLFEYFLVKVGDDELIDVHEVDPFPNVCYNNIEQFIKMKPNKFHLFANRLLENPHFDKVGTVLQIIEYKIKTCLENTNTMKYNISKSGYKHFLNNMDIIEEIIEQCLCDDLIYKLAMIGEGEYLKKATDLSHEQYVNIITKYPQFINYVQYYSLSKEILSKAIDNDCYINIGVPDFVIDSLDDSHREKFFKSSWSDYVSEEIVNKYKYSYPAPAYKYLKKYPKLCDPKLFSLACKFSLGVCKHVDKIFLTKDIFNELFVAGYRCGDFGKIFKKFLDSDVNIDNKNIYLAIQKRPSLIRYISTEHRTQELLELAINTRSCAVEYINPSECDYGKLLDIIIKNFSDAKKSLSFGLNQIDKQYLTEEFYCRSVALNRYILNEIKNQTYKICKMAVKTDLYMPFYSLDENCINLPKYSLQRLIGIKDKGIKKELKKYLVEKYVKCLRS